MRTEFVSRALRAHGSAGNTPAASGFVTPPSYRSPVFASIWVQDSSRSCGGRPIRTNRSGTNANVEVISATRPSSRFRLTATRRFFSYPQTASRRPNFGPETLPTISTVRRSRNCDKKEIRSHDCIAPAAPTGLDGSCLRRAAPSKARNERRRRHLALFPGQSILSHDKRIQRDLPHGWQLGTRGR